LIGQAKGGKAAAGGRAEIDSSQSTRRGTYHNQKNEQDFPHDIYYASG
jgi:hypothetical protein